ncbi:hypothetical protein [Winogradskyella pulchriflava]|uniref:Anti-sigma factor n=1 Tax=Winogradskyella pulchriflava TaxID=1110688 RepID=A0ABV6Q5I9_9FLAO
MAPIKFEEQLKDKLEKRTLSPSADGWAKLSDRLDAEEKKSKSPWFWWVGIAAGVLIMLAIIVQASGSKGIQDTTPKLVEEEKTIEHKIDDLQPNLNEANPTELAIEDEQIETEENIEETVKKPEIIDYKSVIDKKPKAKTQLVDHSKSEDAQETNEVNKDRQALINQTEINKNAVVQAIKDFKAENTTVTDREVDSLLKLASKELFKAKLQKETSKTVDADDLLMSVQDEMGQSFRSKVYEALKDSYETVKTAVAERNN